MKVVRIPVAEARKNLAGILKQVQRGSRVKVTRYNKTLVAFVRSADLRQLEECEERHTPRPRRARAAASRKA